MNRQWWLYASLQAFEALILLYGICFLMVDLLFLQHTWSTTFWLAVTPLTWLSYKAHRDKRRRIEQLTR